MPTPPKTIENMKKHLTNAERAARQNAEGEVKRKKRPQLRCPKWLDDDARKIFEETKKRLKGLELLDNADVEMLAIYSDANSKYREASKRKMLMDEKGVIIGANHDADKDDIASCQSWARLIASYAEKMGLTPTARARLAKRKAERRPVDPFEQLLDEVTDYVNDGNGQ